MIVHMVYSSARILCYTVTKKKVFPILSGCYVKINASYVRSDYQNSPFPGRKAVWELPHAESSWSFPAAA